MAWTRQCFQGLSSTFAKTWGAFCCWRCSALQVRTARYNTSFCAMDSCKNQNREVLHSFNKTCVRAPHAAYFTTSRCLSAPTSEDRVILVSGNKHGKLLAVFEGTRKLQLATEINQHHLSGLKCCRLSAARTIRLCKPHAEPAGRKWCLSRPPVHTVFGHNLGAAQAQQPFDFPHKLSLCTIESRRIGIVAGVTPGQDARCVACHDVPTQKANAPLHLPGFVRVLTHIFGS